MGEALYQGNLFITSPTCRMAKKKTNDCLRAFTMRRRATKPPYGREKTSATCGLLCETGAEAIQRHSLVRWEHGPRSGREKLLVLIDSGSVVGVRSAVHPQAGTQNTQSCTRAP